MVLKNYFTRSGLSVNKEKPAEAEAETEAGLSAVMTLATGSAGGDNIRTESWNGRDYTVVPVVAIVEGVLHGANAAAPEFASAEEFGRFPKAWDGRPVVMNHPQLNGVFVSASIPEVLEGFGMGMIFNSRVEDRKLKCEAWLDHERIEELGGELLSTLERIRNNEVVEVSVGAWLDVAQQKGSFNGKQYFGVWQNVAPDHLAFLSEGVKGACSVADGCGVPRLFSANHAVIGGASACCEDCAHGGSCQGEAAAGTSTSTTIGTLALQLNASEAIGQIQELSHLVDNHGALLELLESAEAVIEVPDASGFTINSVPDSMAFEDIRRVVFQGLCELLNLPQYDVDIMAITASGVVYHIWGKPGLFMRNYSVDGDGAVTFSGDDVPVNLLTRIVPRQGTEPSVNHSGGVEQEENAMSGNTSGGDTPNNEGQGAGAAPVAVAPTFETLLAAAPAAMRESFEAGMAMFNERKTALVAGLVACENCAFSEEELNAFSADKLEKMAKMAGVASYAGRAVPSDIPGLSNNSESQAKPTARFASASIDYLTAPAGGSAQ